MLFRSGEYEIWQYADDGVVDGSSARTDMDYYYGELNSKNTSSTSNKSNVTYNYKVGDDVVISSYYEHSSYGISKAKYYNEPHPHFKIVKIINGAANPYRLSNDSFCNDGDIRSKYTSSNVYTKTDFIKEVQEILGAKVDGIAGSETLGKTITVSKKINNKHKIVVPIQKRLTSLGYNVGTIDGIAGIKFETALKNYQKQYMKTPDGIITAKNTTWKKLLGMTSSNVYTKTDFIKEVQEILGAKVDGIAGSETLGKTITVSKKINNKHKIVVPIQKRLTSLGYNVGTIDGIAGIKFETALKNYQKQYMKTPDGIITAKNTTWKKLLGMI